MQVLVVHEFVGDDDTDLRFVMIARGDGISVVSPIMVLPGVAHFHSGNPYSVYGNSCAEFTGMDKFDLSITVAGCHSGNLEGF